MDHGVAGFHHHYDPELSLIYLTAKGEGGFRVFEITDSHPFVHFLFRHVGTSCMTSTSDTMTSLPASASDSANCEIRRLLRIDVQRKRLDQLSIRVPRRYPQSFKEDVYCGDGSEIRRRHLAPGIAITPRKKSPIRCSVASEVNSENLGVHLHANVTIRRKSPKRMSNASPSVSGSPGVMLCR